MFSVSGWVRKTFRDAGMAGIRDVMEAITPDGEEVPSSVADLRAMLGTAVAPPRQLPAAPDDEPAKKGRK
ncbi:MAG TPA: hypothetical protein VM529_25340 [Gemmata sp.]|nr:hypothetical protein [Gemmata sp.]